MAADWCPHCGARQDFGRCDRDACRRAAREAERPPRIRISARAPTFEARHGIVPGATVATLPWPADKRLPAGRGARDTLYVGGAAGEPVLLFDGEWEEIGRRG